MCVDDLRLTPMYIVLRSAHLLFLLDIAVVYCRVISKPQKLDILFLQFRSENVNGHIASMLFFFFFILYLFTARFSVK